MSYIGHTVLANGIIINTPTTPDTLASVMITPSSISKKALVLQLIPSLSGNIFEVQNQSGIPIVFIDNNGNISINSGAASGAAFYGNGTGLQAINASAISSNGTFNTPQSFNTPTTPDYTANVMISANDGSHKPLVLQSANGVTANVFEIQNYAGTPCLFVDASFNLTVGNSGIGGFINAYYLNVQSGINSSGAITAPSFYGDGSNLTNLPSTGGLADTGYSGMGGTTLDIVAVNSGVSPDNSKWLYVTLGGSGGTSYYIPAWTSI